MKKKTLDLNILSKVRGLPGFPKAEDSDIISLSDPPHYTACPNPFLEEFVKENSTPYDPKEDQYQKTPFASNVSEGKNDPIYNVASYHTKVPPKAIIRYILHFTKPGDLIYDGFCGTGMTGVAAQISNNPDPEFKKIVEKEMPDIQWGERKAILCDLSPIATFIADNMNNPVDSKEFEKESNRILGEIEKEYGWMYQTQHTINGKIQYDIGNKIPVMGKINYTVWSDVFVCPQCSEELVFWDIAVENNDVQDKFSCTNCKSQLTKRGLARSFITIHDSAIGKVAKQTKRVPVLINYTVEELSKQKRYEKTPDQYDLDLIKKTDEMKIKDWYPHNPMMSKGEKWGDTWRKGIHAGITHVHHFYTKRNLCVLSNAYKLISKIHNKHTLNTLLLIFSNVNTSLVSRLTRYNFKKSGNSLLPGTLYVPSFQAERNVLTALTGKILALERITNFKRSGESILHTTQSSTNISQIIDNTIDYIFTDPPFGENIMYSELNFIQESWLKVLTNNETEAIMSDSQSKGLDEYQKLMTDAFSENYRILKPGRWMTVVFHNSQNQVWIAIQEALEKAGFVVADVRTMDKQQETFKQITSSRAVKQDLVISAYKQFGALDQFFGGLTIGTEASVWKFLDNHLKQLPITSEQDGVLQTNAERQKHLLFDRMVAFHIQKGLTVPISASEFYEKLSQKYPERDSMYFLPEQIPEYDRIRAKANSVQQTTIFVEDENSSILWLNEELKTPQTYQDVQPKFLKQLHKSKHEKLPSLPDILKQNFLQDADERWYVPDLTEQKDLERIRIRSLLREFDEYVSSKLKIKEFRNEAIRAGFKKCWDEQNYADILKVAKKIPESKLREDAYLVRFYDNAEMLM